MSPCQAPASVGSASLLGCHQSRPRLELHVFCGLADESAESAEVLCNWCVEFRVPNFHVNTNIDL